MSDNLAENFRSIDEKRMALEDAIAEELDADRVHISSVDERHGFKSGENGAVSTKFHDVEMTVVWEANGNE